MRRENFQQMATLSRDLKHDHEAYHGLQCGERSLFFLLNDPFDRQRTLGSIYITNNQIEEISH